MFECLEAIRNSPIQLRNDPPPASVQQLHAHSLASEDAQQRCGMPVVAGSDSGHYGRRHSHELAG
jgi:hypothetical protein